MKAVVDGSITVISPSKVASTCEKAGVGDMILEAGLVGVPSLAILTAWNPSSLAEAVVESCAFILAFVTLLIRVRRKQCLYHPLFLAAVTLPIIGCVQLATRFPAYPFAAIRAVLYWGSVAALTLAAGLQLDTRRSRSLVLSLIGVLGLLATFLELHQIYGKHRYGLTATGYPLLSSNYYAELIELILPVILSRAFRDQRLWWLHLTLTCLLVSTVIATAARVGTILVLLECIVLVCLNFSRLLLLRRQWTKICTAFVALVTACVLLQGPSTLVKRLGEAEPLAGRSEITRSAVDMIRSRPMKGYGLGSFPVVYPAFAHFDDGYFVNHAHNDWLEAMTDGGPLLLAALAAFIFFSGYLGVRATWGFGLAVLPLHAAVDFPLQRPGVMLLYAVIAGAAYARYTQYGCELLPITSVPATII